MSITILLADDHKIMREGLRALLATEPDMEVVGEAEDGRATARLVGELMPDVVIMDVAMPDLNGIDAARRITAAAPGVKVVALSMHSDKRFVAGMLRAGASGYLRKGCSFEELVHAIRTVAASQTYLSPQIAGVVTEDYVQRLAEDGRSPAPVLTPREREVLQLLAEGTTSKQAAIILGISQKTVLSHRRNIMKKLGASSLAEIVKYAIRQGLTSLES